MDKKIFTVEDIEKFNALNDSVRGTNDYAKYGMYHECNWKNEDGKWVGWKAGCWSDRIYMKGPFTIKKVKDRMYLITPEYVSLNTICKDRYEVTGTIKEVLGL